MKMSETELNQLLDTIEEQTESQGALEQVAFYKDQLDDGEYVNPLEAILDILPHTEPGIAAALKAVINR